MVWSPSTSSVVWPLRTMIIRLSRCGTARRVSWRWPRSRPRSIALCGPARPGPRSRYRSRHRDRPARPARGVDLRLPQRDVHLGGRPHWRAPFSIWLPRSVLARRPGCARSVWRSEARSPVGDEPGDAADVVPAGRGELPIGPRPPRRRGPLRRLSDQESITAGWVNWQDTSRSA